MAEKFGYPSVSKMLREVTSKELSEWQAFFNIKDFVLEERKKAAEAKDRARRNNR